MYVSLLPSGVTCTKSVSVRIFGVTVKMMRGMPPRIDDFTVTNGNYKAKGMTISRSGVWVILYSSKLQLTVMYDEGKFECVY
jgi:hypothetical protein